MKMDIIAKNMNSNKYFDFINYPELTIRDVERLQRLNKRNHYGITVPAFKELVYSHRRARKLNNTRYMSQIEYRLNDLNFRSDSLLLKEGLYNKVLEAIKEYEEKDHIYV